MPDAAFSGDRRLTPARADVAAASLRGHVEAGRFVEGEMRQVAQTIADVRERPAAESRLETQLLFGDAFLVLDVADGWAWGQNQADGYVGYVAADAFAPLIAPTHRVRALRTLSFPELDIKSAPALPLSFGARVTVEALDGRFAKIAHGGWVFAEHLAPLDARESDWVAIAERFVGTPYLWGGKSAAGIDCSGLIQVALESARIAAPRDTDLQENALGEIVPASALQRGDLVFWQGHVGVMLDAERLLHANAHHMATQIEPLAVAEVRIRDAGWPISSVKRL